MPFISRSATCALCTTLALALGACGGDSPSDPGNQTPANSTPVADAGANVLQAVGSTVELDASGSSDSDGDALTYVWALTTPPGSTASLSSTTDEMPTFTPDVAGSYTADLTVSDGTASAAATVDVLAVEAQCDAIVDLVPTPATPATSIFADLDDAFASVDFATGFQFPFFGQTYNEIYLNTNGGMTLGSGVPAFDVEASLLGVPTIAPFWGDMAPESAPDRPGQMYYEACADRFVMYYRQLQDFDDDRWDNSATVTLFNDGTIVFDYGLVGSEDIMVGIFDGQHTADEYVSVQDDYFDYASSSGTILFDDFGAGPTHTGDLSDRTITFHPAPAPAPSSAAPTPLAMTDRTDSTPRVKNKK